MGIIKDGSISGVLPSTRDTFAVHYPGYPSSIERAIETLGGDEGILKARTNNSNDLNKYLKLRFRPEDPYSHPAFGKPQPCHNFLLRISKKKVKDINRISENVSEDSVHINQDSSHSKLNETSDIIQPECESLSTSIEVEAQRENAEEQMSADIVAQVSEAYHFKGMADYQYVLPVHADANRRKKRNWTDVEPQFEKGGLIDVDQEDLMILVPPLFTTKDLPENLVLRQSIGPSMKKKPEGLAKMRFEMEMERCVALDFNIKEIPKKVNWEQKIPRDSDKWKLQSAVCELFDERPIWVKNSLVERLVDQGLKVQANMLKRLLHVAAYYFSNGPFLKFYIRKGYDPRTDPDSRIYQRTEFRVQPQLRNYCDTNFASGLTNRWEDICAFRVFPYKYQTSLQLFELKDDYIQQEIRKPATQKSCSLQTGWFSSQVIDTLRLCVAEKFLSVYPNQTIAESLLKTVSKSLKKSKMAHLNLKDSKVGEKEKQPNKEVVASEDEALSDEVEYEEDEEDEMEDDNLEEDMDAEEDPDLVNAETSGLQSRSYTDHDNMSKGYLQQLFDRFPLNAVGGAVMEDADPYDGEYQIYDQEDSDEGNYSEDENN